MNILGIDNLFFEVSDVEKASKFFQQFSFKEKISIPHLKAVLLSIGLEQPGLILCQKKSVTPSKIWVEIEDAKKMKAYCASIEIQGNEIETSTGITFEIQDSDGNKIGFADYSKKSQLGRSHNLYFSVKGIAGEYASRVWNEKDLSAIDELVHPEVIIHSLLGDFYGQAAMKNIVQAWLTGFPDLKVSHEIIISENDTVSIQWSAKGTHLGEFKGREPTGNPISYSGVTIYRIKNNKIIEYWAYLDMQHLLNQI